MSKVEYIRFRRDWHNRTDSGKDAIAGIESGDLAVVKGGLRIDTEYHTILKIGDVYIEVCTSEWGTIKVTDKIQLDTIYSDGIP